MLKSIHLSNLRSYSGNYNIPLRRFVLLYGNNGSGKSSLIEAIQLAMTGRTERTNLESSVDIAQEIKSVNSSSDVFIRLIGENEELLSEFSRNGPASNYSKLLRDFYKRDTSHHMTARSLLDTLFTTHNLLTQERIIKLLDSESKEEFSNAVEEMIVGRNLIERWDKIKLLRAFITKKNDSSIISFNDTLAQINLLENHLREWSKVSDEDNKKQIDEIILQYAEGKLKYEEKPLNESPEVLLSWLRHSRESLQVLRALIDTLRNENIIGNSIIISKLTLERSTALKALETLREKIEEGKKKKGERKEGYSNALKLIADKNEEDKETAYLNKLKKENIDNLKIIDEWRLEIMCDQELESIKKELFEVESKFHILKQATDVANNLPDPITIETERNNLIAWKKNLENEEQKLETKKVKLEEAESNHLKLKQGFSEWEKHQAARVVLFENLNRDVNQFLSNDQGCECPTCGTSFKDRQGLIIAIENNMKLVRNKYTDQPPAILAEIPIAENRMKGLVSEIEQDSQNLIQLRNKIGDCDGNINARVKTALIVKALFTKLEIINIVDPAISLIQFIIDVRNQDLPLNLSKIQERIALLEAKLESRWAGLRKNEYEGRKENLHEILRYSVSKQVALSLEDSEVWKTYIEEMIEDFKISFAMRERCANDLGELIKSRDKIEIELRHATETEKEQEESFEKISRELNRLVKILNTLEKLKSFMSGIGDEIDQVGLTTTVEALLAKTNALEESLIITINSHKQREEFDNKIQELRGKNVYESCSLSIIKDLSERLKTIPELDQLIKKEWAKYSSKINDFFSKLHCPSDFINVIINNSSKNLELKVIARNELEKPATVLSSGQRAALALAIFWTLNIYSQDAPPLILMDEPIHQVDDVNSINFLDSLRWIVEKTDRQVVLSTANNRIAGLVRRKFSYLNSNYLELHMERVSDMPTIVKCVGPGGETVQEIYSRKSA